MPMPAKLMLSLTIAALSIGGFRLNAAFGQAVSSQVPVLSPGVHSRGLAVSGELAVRYAISIPANYSASRPVPLILALHFGGSPVGAGTSLLGILVRPALEELGAIIVAPDSVRGQWNTSENERAVNALLDGVLKSY